MNGPIVSSIVSAFATAGAVTAIFWKFEDTASPQLKARVTEWLRFKGGTLQADTLGRQLSAVLDGYFGLRLFSAKAMVRSIYASLIAVVIMTCIWSALRSNEFLALASDLANYLYLIGAAAPLNCIPDYLSYVKSRLIIRRMSHADSVLQLLLLATLDLLLTLSIFCIGVIALVVVLDIAIEGISKLQSDLPEFLLRFTDVARLKRMLTLGLEEGAELPFGIYFYASLLVSLWALLYSFSAVLMKFILRWYPIVSPNIVSILDVDGHPIRSLGCVAGLLVFVAVLVGTVVGSWI
jgi:hypothetical protein